MQLITEGVWQLSGLLPDVINAYLVEDVLIDCMSRWDRRSIIQQLRGQDIRLVALTHCHPDHQGLAKFLCQRFRVPLACHAWGRCFGNVGGQCTPTTGSCEQVCGSWRDYLIQFSMFCESPAPLLPELLFGSTRMDCWSGHMA